jgi:predicted nucleic acid-binding protein
MGPLILDAGVVIGLLDAADAHHSRAVDEVDAADHQGRTLLLPASAYSELLVAFARAARIPEARETVAAMGITVIPLTAAIAETAAQLRSSHRHLRLPDAIVLASARAHDGELLSYARRLDRLAGGDEPDTGS